VRYRLPTLVDTDTSPELFYLEIPVLLHILFFATHYCSRIPGIGTRWEGNGVTGPDSQNCPYKGAKANAEYAVISGCAVVPTEQGGGNGTACGHWDEDCLGSELMTGYLNSGFNPLSRITVATLQDLGYTVDYSTADAFTRNNLNASCVCRRRTLMDMMHGETHQLGLRVPGVQRRRLSDEAYNAAMTYGQAILASRKFGSLLVLGDMSADVAYVADKVVNVLVADNGGFLDIVVRANA
jgi:Leishmanolysin